MAAFHSEVSAVSEISEISAISARAEFTIIPGAEVPGPGAEEVPWEAELDRDG
jgi:hypothetical protein